MKSIDGGGYRLRRPSVRVPQAGEWIRVHPDPAYRDEVTLTRDEGGACYLIAPALVPKLLATPSASRVACTALQMAVGSVFVLPFEHRGAVMVLLGDGLGLGGWKRSCAELGVVAAMGVEIDNRRVFGTVASLRMTDCNRCIVEKAKTHGSGGFRVMTGWADRDECVFRPSSHDLINGQDCTTSSAQACLETITGGNVSALRIGPNRSPRRDR